MSIVLIYAGELAEPIDLLTRLEELHEEDRAWKLGEIARRTANGAPLDGLNDPGPFVRREDLAGVTVRVRVLTERRNSLLDSKHLASMKAYAAAASATPPIEEDVEAKMFAMYDAKCDLVAEAVAGVDGLESGPIVAGADGKLSPKVIDAFDRARLNRVLYDVAKSVQGLGSKKAWRSGPSPART